MSQQVHLAERNPDAPAAATASPVLLGFDFFGSENIGDDLSLDGFLRAVDRLGIGPGLALTATSSHCIDSQRRRFGRAAWIYRPEVPREQLLSARPFTAWVGVGDTPLQHSLGTWQLDFLEAELAALDPAVPCVMVNIGAESEIRPVADRFAAVLRRFCRVSTRDEHSLRIVVEELGVPRERVALGSDLAHVALAELFRERPARRRHRLGIVVAADTMRPGDLVEIKRFLLGRRGRAAFIAADSSDRPYCERATFRWMGSRPWSRLRFKARLVAPDYHGGTMADLVRPFAGCETLISSRYHGLLAGAWAGCRVAAISRSSKVECLAGELGVPIARLPVRRTDLQSLERDAVVIPRERLLPYRDRAIRGVEFALGGLA